MPHGPPLSLHIRCNTKGTITPCIFQAVFLVFFRPPEKFSLISSDNENTKKDSAAPPSDLRRGSLRAGT